MDLSTWLVFVLAAFLTSLSPGPATLLAVSNSVGFGRAQAFFSSIGNATGIFLVSSVSMLGLGAVLAASATLFLVFKTMGALYLMFLGYRQWVSKENVFARTATASAGKGSAFKFYRQGLLVAVTNPKSIVFFTALFPQFIKTGGSLMAQFFTLTLTFIACSLCTHLLYVMLSGQIKAWFGQSHRAMWFNRVSGGVFMLFGVGVFRVKNLSSQ